MKQERDNLTRDNLTLLELREERPLGIHGGAFLVQQALRQEELKERLEYIFPCSILGSERMCVCVWVRERDRGTDRETERGTERQRQRMGQNE